MVISLRSVNRPISLCFPSSSRAFSSNLVSPQLAISISLLVIALRAEATSIASICPYVLRNAAAAKAVFGVFSAETFLDFIAASSKAFSLAASSPETSNFAPRSTCNSAVLPAIAISSAKVAPTSSDVL